MSEFEWDPIKRDSNLTRHGLDFADVDAIFDDPDLVETQDNRRDYGEVRLQVIGQVEGEILFVVYTWRGTKRRLISARKAHLDERKVYQERKAGA